MHERKRQIQSTLADHERGARRLTRQRRAELLKELRVICAAEDKDVDEGERDTWPACLGFDPDLWT